MQTRWVLALIVIISACSQPTDDTAEPPSSEVVSENASREGAPWDERFYNPLPADDDLVIEGPCGSRFVFRRIETETVDNWLAAETVIMGQDAGTEAAVDRAVTEGVRSVGVVGAFSDTGTADSRHYYIGKYEITEDQFVAVLGETCPDPTDMGTLPKSGVAKYEAQQLTVKLTEWIYAHPDAKAGLPTVDGMPAMVRLPSEAEWEFAARGGQNVDPEERIAPIYPMDDYEEAYEWFRGDASCSGSIQPIGYLLPNPVGLHDILGNVREIVLDSFQLTAGRRLQGQVGAMLTKGGACDTAIEDLRSSARREYPEYDHEAGQLNRPPMVGFRLALGGPAIPSVGRQSAYTQDFERLRQPRTGVLADGSDPAATLRALAEEVDDEEIMSSLERVAGAIDAEMVDRNMFEIDNAKALVTSAAALIRSYRASTKTANQLDLVLGESIEEASRAGYERQRNNAMATSEISRDIYATSLMRAVEFDPVRLAQAARFVAEENEGRHEVTAGALSLSQMMCLFAAQTLDYRQNRPGSLDAYFEELVMIDPDSAPSCPRVD